jgi:tRNA(fMet)-specific endonuclease VapC
LTTSYLLDTNIASEFIRSKSLDRRILSIPISQLSISSITEAEIRYGLAKRPHATKLHDLANLFLQTVEIREFDSSAGRSYGWLRAAYEQAGLSVGNLDALIAAHAHSLGMTFVTRDASLLRLQSWIRVKQW